MLQITHIAVQYIVSLGIIDLQRMKYNILGEIITCDSSIHKVDYPKHFIGLKRANCILLECALKLFNFAMTESI